MTSIDNGADQVTFADMLTEAETALATLAGSATQYAVVEDGTTDAGNGNVGLIAAANAYLFIDWDGDATADEAILLSGVTTADIEAANILAALPA